MSNRSISVIRRLKSIIFKKTGEMKLNFLKKIVILTACIYLPFQTMAWGVLGHRIVGQIADSYLTKKARKAIGAILGNESVAMSSNWMDFIKSDPAYKYLYNWHF